MIATYHTRIAQRIVSYSGNEHTLTTGSSSSIPRPQSLRLYRVSVFKTVHTEYVCSSCEELCSVQYSNVQSKIHNAQQHKIYTHLKSKMLQLSNLSLMMIVLLKRCLTCMYDVCIFIVTSLQSQYTVTFVQGNTQRTSNESSCF